MDSTYEAMVAWAAAHAAHFWGGPGAAAAGQPPDGWIGAWRVTIGGRDYCGVATHAAREWLIDRGLQPEATLRALVDAGYVLGDQRGQSSRPVRLGAIGVIRAVLLAWPVD